MRDVTLGAWLDALAAPRPMPGGCAAAAVGGAMGAALLAMAAGLAARRTPSEQLGRTLADLDACRAQLLQLAEDDQTAWDALVLAGRQARTAPEDAATQAALEAARAHATDVPLRVLHAASDALAHAAGLVGVCPEPARGDLAAGVDLLTAASAAAVRTVRVNAGTLSDAVRRHALLNEADAMEAAVADRRAAWRREAVS